MLRPAGPHPTIIARGWVVLLSVLLLAAVIFRISITPDRFLDVDELEHLNAAYAIGNGETLYGSLFENHPPFLVWSLQPLVKTQEEAESLIRAARWLMLLPCLGLLGVTSRIGFRLSGWSGGLGAPLFLLSSVFFFEKGVEVRPDVPGSFFALLAMLLLSGRRPWAWFAAGASLGITGFFTPKAVFVALGMLAGLAVYVRSSSAAFQVAAPLGPARESRGAAPTQGSGASLTQGIGAPPTRGSGALAHSYRTVLLRLGWVGLGTAAVAAAVVLVLVSQGSWSGFWRDCVQTSARMTIDDPGAMRRALLEDTVLRANPALWLAGLFGTCWLVRDAWRFRSESRGGDRSGSRPSRSGTPIGFVGSRRHSGSRSLVAKESQSDSRSLVVNESQPDSRSQRDRPRSPYEREGPQSAALRWMVPTSLVGGFAGFFLMEAPLRQYFLFFLPQLAIAAAHAATVVVRVFRAQLLAAGVALAVLAAMLIPPWTVILPVQRQGLELEILRTVLATTRPNQRVLDLWSGLYVTRLPAYRYFFLNSDVLRLIPSSQLESDLLRALNDSRVTVVIADDHFRLLPAAVQQRIRSEFAVVKDYGFLAVLARGSP